MTISKAASWGFIILGAVLAVAGAIDILSRRPADVLQEPVGLTISLVLVVVGVCLVVVGVVKRRRLTQ